MSECRGGFSQLPKMSAEKTFLGFKKWKSFVLSFLTMSKISCIFQFIKLLSNLGICLFIFQWAWLKIPSIKSKQRLSSLNRYLLIYLISWDHMIQTILVVFCYFQLKSHTYLHIQMIHQFTRTKRGAIVFGHNYVFLTIVPPSYSLRESAWR